MKNLLKAIPETATRSLSVDNIREALDVKTRTLKMSFSSDEPVEMRGWDGSFNEILEHGAENVRLKRLNSQAPLLFNHNRDALVGVIEQATVDGKRGTVTVRFAKDEEGEKRFQQVQDGILSNVSVGYRKFRVVSEESEESGLETVRVTDWEPYEVSLVTVPADTSVGVGRAKQSDEHSVLVERQSPPQNKESIMDPKDTKDPVDVRTVSQDATKAERKRVSELDAVAQLFMSKGADVREVLEKAKRDGQSVDEFRVNAIGCLPEVKPAGEAPVMNAEDQRRYSISRAIACAMPGGRIDGLEGEWHQELLRQMPRKPQNIGIVMPNEIVGLGAQRTMTAGAPAAGGSLVAEQTLQSIGKLDRKPIVEQAGARRLTGLTGDVVFPKITGGATAYWLGETEAIDASDLSTGVLRMTPKRLGVLTKISNQLGVQANESMEAITREDMNKRIMLAIDLAALNGSGASGEPKGLFQLDTSSSGINTVTYGAAATFAKTNEALATIMTDNALVGDIAELISPAAWAKWASKSVDTGSGKFLWNGGLEDGKIGVGIKGLITNQLPSDKSVVGVWSELMFGFWNGVNVIVDPYTSKTSGLIELYMEMLADVAVRNAEAFCVSTDSAAQ